MADQSNKNAYKPCTLFRPQPDNNAERYVVEEYFDTYTLRSEVPPNSLVIGRYSVLPYYNELLTDLHNNGSKLINNNMQHKYIANAWWIPDVQYATPQTWTDETIYQAPKDMQFIVKGCTNSRKNQWGQMMRAEDRRDALNKAAILKTDSLIGQQEILYREYVPLESYGELIGGCPISNEWRFFCFRDKVLCYGYYWSIADQDIIDSVKLDGAAFDLVKDLSRVIGMYTNFYVLDIAKTVKGDWILIEVNDGCCSGLSECDPHELYKNLKEAINDSDLSTVAY